jgi:hypothetical protein
MLEIRIDQYLAGIAIYNTNLPDFCGAQYVHDGLYIEANPSLPPTLLPLQKFLHKGGYQLISYSRANDYPNFPQEISLPHERLAEGDVGTSEFGK